MNADIADKLIFLQIGDNSLCSELSAALVQEGYQVKILQDLSEYEQACKQSSPDLLVMDFVIIDEEIVGEESIALLKNKVDYFPPIVVVSERSDIAARLAMAHMGVSRYVDLPLKLSDIIRSISGLLSATDTQPYKVLLIDDDEVILNIHSIALSEAGVIVKVLNDPLQAISVLESFKPDVLVTDIRMPGCSGLELAKIIRQNDFWSLMPIMFVSGAPVAGQQIALADLDCDDFIAKPVELSYLVSSVLSRASRARCAMQLNNKLEESLRESEFQLIAMNQHNIVSTADVKGDIVDVNDRFCDSTGYSREELSGLNHRILKSDYHSDDFYENLWVTISNGDVWRGTICNKNKNGDHYWVDSTIVPFLKQDGRPYKYVSIRTNITALKESEDRLQRSQRFANIGNWDWNIVTGDLHWSDRIASLFGYTEALPEISYDNFLAAVHPEDRESVIDAATRCVEHNEKYDIEHRVVWQDGSIHWVHESGNVVRDNNGLATHMLGVAQDIDARKRVEQELVDTREDAISANRAKSKFLSSMSHELRTPMNAIMGFGQLLKTDVQNPLNQDQSENVEEIMKASDHLLELINEVLDLAKIEEGRIDLYVEPVVLGEVFLEAMQLILPLAQKRGIDITVAMAGEEFPIEDMINRFKVVTADRTRLRQVLLNLLSNAVKYNGECGKLLIDCEQRDPETLRVSITDTGAGLTEAQQSKLFTAFNRLGAEQSDIEGTGIGLLISKKIIELMGGAIGVKSVMGKGSTFWIELPCDDHCEVIANESNRGGDMPVESKESGGGKYSVLYIEDNPANLRLVAQMLSRKENVNMWSAHEPVLGLELAATHKPDLILLDINLPGMDGYEVLQLFRLREATRDTIIIAVSANAMPKDIEKGLAAGFNDYITKPIDVNIFFETVDKALKAVGKRKE